MSEIQRMIERLCPDGVPFVAMEDLGSFYGGLSGKSKKDFTDGNALFITYMNVYSNPGFDLTIDDKVKISEGEKQNPIHKGDVLFTGSSETPDECGMSSVVLVEPNEDCYLNSFCFGYRFNDISMFDLVFLKHLFRSAEMRKAISGTANGVTRFNVSKKAFAKVELPILPIDIQRRIGEVLDSFSEHTAALVTELDAELTARKKQYVYYQKAVVEEQAQGSPMMALADICSVITDGSHFSPSATDSEEYFYMPSVKDMHDNCFDFSSCKRIGKRDYEELVSNGCQPHLNDVLIAKDGATMLKYVFVVKEEKEIVVLSSIAILRPRLDLVYPEYLAHYFRQEWFRQYVINKFSSKAGVPRIVLKNFKRIEIPIPSIEAQKRIVSILDRFEALTSNFAESLSAEIKARQQQYEYYRNQLLTFKRAN